MELNDEYYKIGIRRTGISNTYQDEKLQKDKSRKTNNRSKRSTITVSSKVEEIQLSLGDEFAWENLLKIF